LYILCFVFQFFANIIILLSSKWGAGQRLWSAPLFCAHIPASFFTQRKNIDITSNPPIIINVLSASRCAKKTVRINLEVIKMKCLKCGQENRNDVKRCINCNTPMMWTPDTDLYEPEIIVKVSRIAIIAAVLALVGLMFLFFGFIAPFPRTQSLILINRGMLILTSLIMFILAIILGFISFIQIEISGGRKTGVSFSVGAIVISILGCIIPIGPLFFARTHSVAYYNVCGTNLSGLGKAMLVYANDYDDELPRAGGKNATWGASVKWDASTQREAYGQKQDGTGGSATISSSLYLLVKYADVTPKSFICKGDPGVSELKLSGNTDLVNLWDFGSQPWLHNSYAYHMPYGSYALTTSSDPGMVVAADRNPWISSAGWGVKNFSTFNPNGNINSIKEGNCFTHKNEGQNVLYLDTHVNFESVSFCGINQDNIYTSWNGSEIRKGTQPVFGSQPAGRTDSLLLNDPSVTKP
jgi:hypothetical protein